MNPLTHIAWRPVLGAVLALAVATSLGTARSAPAGAAAPDTRVPILMYHVLGDPPAGAPFPDLYVPTSDFGAQLRWLARHGYHPVTLRRVWEHWRRGSPLPLKPVVVSFDDGHRSTAEVALPRLRERGWPGVLNLKTRSLERKWGLRPRQVRALIAAGWEIDAHSITHPDLTAVGDRRLEAEVAGSRAIIRRRFGVAADFFCYPSGRYDGRVIAAVRRAGFLGATTTVDGLADSAELFTLRRVRVARGDGVAGLAAQHARLTPPEPSRRGGRLSGLERNVPCAGVDVLQRRVPRTALPAVALPRWRTVSRPLPAGWGPLRPSRHDDGRHPYRSGAPSRRLPDARPDGRRPRLHRARGLS